MSRHADNAAGPEIVARVPEGETSSIEVPIRERNGVRQASSNEIMATTQVLGQ